MAQVYSPTYSSISSNFAPSGFASLGNGSVQTSDMIDNSSAAYQDYLISIGVTGTAATNGFLEVRISPSLDNSVFTTWESSVSLGLIDFSVTPQTVTFSIIGHGAFFQSPKYFKILVKNSTGAVLTGGVMYWQGVTIQTSSA
jgi:hypothetical protein